jgi:protein-tyrosine phosphatase
MRARHVPLEGAQNFRDFGGYATEDGRQVKGGHLFRSGRLDTLSAADHQVMEEIGVKLICDLRRGSEFEGAPISWCARPAPAILHVPLLQDNSTDGMSGWRQAAFSGQVRERMLEIYCSLVTDPSAVMGYRTLFARLASEESYPLVIHCTAGKDRTGVACALILGALGVSRQDVIADYLLSRIYYDGNKDLMRATGQALDLVAAYGAGDTLAPIFHAEPAYLEAALGAIEEKYGSTREFLLMQAGVPRAHLDAMAANLLEPPVSVDRE